MQRRDAAREDVERMRAALERLAPLDTTTLGSMPQAMRDSWREHIETAMSALSGGGRHNKAAPPAGGCSTGKVLLAVRALHVH